MSETVDVFVIGAGPAGLTAAYCLTKETPSVLMIEKDPTYVGGISRTVRYKDFLFDIGGHRFFSKSKEVVDLWREILPDDFIARPRLSRIYYGGKYYSYPLSAFEALRNLGLVTSAACMLSYAYAKAKPIAAPKSFHEWVRNQFGERLFQIFFKTYTEKVWGMSCDEISADWAAQRIKGLDLRVAVTNALKRSLGLGRKRAKPGQDPDNDVVKTLIETFQYPRRGPGMMWEAATAKIKERGGRIMMGRELAGLSYDAGRRLWTIEVATADGARETYAARHVVSSAPVRELVAKIAPAPISLLHARALRYRDFLTVALMVDKPDLFPDNWIYIHDPSVKVGRVQNFNSWSPEMVPNGMTCLGLEYFCFEGDGLWNAPDEDLIALAKREIAQIGLVGAADVVDGCVVRQPKAYPVYDEDYREHVATIRRDLESTYPTLHLVGRNGMHKYNNQDHAMMTAMLTARNILAGERIYDTWQVNEDAEYHEAGAAGAQAALASERLVPRRKDLARGLKLKPGYFDRAAQEELARDILDIIAAAPLFVPRMPNSGKPFTVRMTNCGPLGWVSDERGYRYQPHHPQTGAPWPPIPARVLAAWRDLADYPHPPEACLINVYAPTARMGLHQDRDEADFAAPVVSLSLGQTCLFRVGGTRRDDPTRSFRLASGDAVVLGGDTRLAFHGVDRIIRDTSTLLPDGSRINLTLRRVTEPV